MRNFSQWLALCALASLGACSNDSSSTLSGSEATHENPVVVVMGGFNSCLDDGEGGLTPVGMDRWFKGEAISSRYAQGESHWVRSCFDTAGGLYFIAASAPATVQWTTLDNLLPFFEAVKAETEAGRNPVYLIGHSYGGWLGMYAAYWLPSNVRVRRLYTVDPISPYYCTPETYWRALVDSSALAGCQEAPRDWTDEYLTPMFQRLPERGWVHYYQRNFFPLMSSWWPGNVQPHASYDASPFLSVSEDGAHASWNAHVGIDELSLVWHSFETVIGVDLGYE